MSASGCATFGGRSLVAPGFGVALASAFRSGD